MMKIDIEAIIDDSYSKLDQFRNSTLKQWLDMILAYIDISVDDFRSKTVEEISK
jgi:hypothetical protein